jgi:hypothetical protein
MHWDVSYTINHPIIPNNGLLEPYNSDTGKLSLVYCTVLRRFLRVCSWSTYLHGTSHTVLSHIQATVSPASTKEPNV